MPDLADQQLGLADAVKALLQRVAQPIDLDLLVDAIGGVLGVDDRQPIWSSTEQLDAALDAADPAQPISQTLMYRQYLSHLWTEACELPLKQRVAILLNLRDDEGRSALPMLPLAVLLAEAGVLDEAERELTIARSANPESSAVKRLQASISSLRR
jgi:hypothetical protein